MSKQDTSKLWGGRFSEATDSFVQRFTASVNFDRRMAAEDIAGSRPRRNAVRGGRAYLRKSWQISNAAWPRCRKK